MIGFLANANRGSGSLEQVEREYWQLNLEFQEYLAHPGKLDPWSPLAVLVNRQLLDVPNMFSWSLKYGSANLNRQKFSPEGVTT